MNLLNGHNRVSIFLITLGLLAGLSVSARAQGDRAAVERGSPFRFEMTDGGNPYRGRAVEGYLYNGLPWRITNVRVRVESVDSVGAVTAESYGWVLGDISAGGRGYFYLPVSRPAPSYRARVESFDKVAREAPEAP